MLASLPTLRCRHAVLAAAACLGVALVAPVAAADTPPDLPPLGTPSGALAAPPAPLVPLAPLAGPPAAAVPAAWVPQATPGAPAPPHGYPPPAGMPPGLSWMSPGEVPPGYSVPYPGAYPMTYQQAAPRQDNYELPEPPARRHQSTGMFVGGVLMVSGGLVAVIAGAVLVSTSANRVDIYCDSPSFPCGHKDDAARKNVGAALMAIGGLAGAAGIPVWLVGARLVPVPRAQKRPALVPELRVGAGVARVTVSF